MQRFEEEIARITNCAFKKARLVVYNVCYFSYNIQYSKQLLDQSVPVLQMSESYVLNKMTLCFGEGGFLS